MVCATVGVGIAVFNGRDALVPAERAVAEEFSIEGDVDLVPREESQRRHAADTTDVVIPPGSRETNQDQHQPASNDSATHHNIGQPSDPDTPQVVAESNTVVSDIGTSADPNDTAFHEERSGKVRNVDAFADPDATYTSSTQAKVRDMGDFIDPDVVALKNSDAPPVDTGDSLEPDD